jgi:prepilin-type N-terminal cleavage/methylation domain-containing protein
MQRAAGARAESGLTLVEVVVTVSLLSIVSAVFLPLLATASRSVHPMQVQSQSIDSLRNALASIGREMRSAACVTEPAANAGASNRLRFTTDANNSSYEVTYTATAGQLLRQVTGESTVTLLETGLVNPGDAFTHIATPRRTVKVVFHFQPDPKRPVLDLSTVVAGRNAWHAC